MRNSILFIAAFLTTSTSVFAQEVSGDVAIQSGYPDDNGYDYTHEPTAIASIAVEFGNLEASVTGYKSLRQQTGDELDLTLNYSDEVKSFQITGTAEYFMLRGSDQVHVELSVARETNIGTFDTAVGHYFSKGDDATRFQIGFAPKTSEQFNLRFYATHERGYDLPSITTAAVSLEWHLDDRWSLTGNLVVPLNNLPDGDERGTVGMIGLTYTF